MALALKKHRLDDTVVCVLGTTETQGHNYFQTVSEFLFFDDANAETKLATQQISLHVRPDGKQGMGTFPVGTILKFDGVRAWGPAA